MQLKGIDRTSHVELRKSLTPFANQILEAMYQHPNASVNGVNRGGLDRELAYRTFKVGLLKHADAQRYDDEQTEYLMDEQHVLPAFEDAFSGYRRRAQMGHPYSPLGKGERPKLLPVPEPRNGPLMKRIEQFVGDPGSSPIGSGGSPGQRQHAIAAFEAAIRSEDFD